MMACVFKTPGKHGYAVEFSPFIAHRLASVCCEEYGIKGAFSSLQALHTPIIIFISHARRCVAWLCVSGSGSIIVLDIIPNSLPVLVKSFDWPDGLFDVTWSESNQNVAVTAAGDGSIQAWNISRPKVLMFNKLIILELSAENSLGGFIKPEYLCYTSFETENLAECNYL